MTASNPQADAARATAGGQVSGIVIAGVLLLVIVLVAIVLYVTIPGPTGGDHFYALVAIGVLGLVVSVLAVVAEALTRDPAIAKATSAGSFWFGIAVLLGAGLVCPDPAFGGSGTAVTFGTWRLVYLIVVLLLAVAGLLVQRWQFYNKAADIPREAARQAWRARTGAGTGATGAPSPNDPRMNPPPG